MENIPPSRSLPTPLVVLPVPLIIAFAVCYRALAPRVSTRKKQSYILSVITSGTMSLTSLRYGRALAVDGWDGLLGRAATDPGLWLLSRHDMATWTTAFFTGYLAADVRDIGMLSPGMSREPNEIHRTLMQLIVGYFHYPEQVGFLTGWVHHLVYIVITVYLQFTSWTCLFMLACLMEIPTFHLGLSTICPELFRHDAIFLVLFFLIRIVFHIYLLLTFTASPFVAAWMGIDSALEAVGRRWVPAVLIASALPLHVMWFHGGFVGYLRRRRSRKPTSETETVTQSPFVSSAQAEPQVLKDAAHNDIEILASPVAADASKWDALAPPTPCLGAAPLTPPETPLMTPATSLGLSGAGSGYFFQNVNSSLPKLPSLYQLQLPLGLPNLREYAFPTKSSQQDDAGQGPKPKRRRVTRGRSHKGEVDTGNPDRRRFASAVFARIPSMRSVRERLNLKRKLSEVEGEVAMSI